MTAYRALIEQIAGDFGLDVNLVEAVVMAESNGCTDAFRFEQGFYDDYLKGKPEWASWNPRRIASSYGLMQIMYVTAKEHGFGDMPELLFIPDVGVKFGVMYLRKMLRLNDGNQKLALASYNAGFGNRTGSRGSKYAARVLALYDVIKQAHA